MDANEKVQLKAKITEQIAMLRREITSLEEATQPISPENAIGRVSRMDAINNKGVAEAALRSARRKLSKLRAAKENIEKVGFGICSLCKQAIPQARLMYLPESTRCVRCADRR